MSTASDLLPDLTGQFIDDGELELVRLLGSGGFGKVYKALDTTSSTDDPEYFAVKCMPRYEPGSRQATVQEREIRTHLTLYDHSHVVGFHRHFSTDQYVFVVLELCEGGDMYGALRDGLYTANPLLIKKAFGELLDAVDFCHRHETFHRDLKPANVLLTAAGEIRLADFGLATDVEYLPRACGTRAYICPEALDPDEDEGHSARYSDLWALSIILVNMISRRYPWYSADMSDDGYRRFREGDDRVLDKLRLTPPARELIQRCFAEDPRRRPTLKKLREAVEAIEVFSLQAPSTHPFPNQPLDSSMLFIASASASFPSSLAHSPSPPSKMTHGGIGQYLTPPPAFPGPASSLFSTFSSSSELEFLRPFSPSSPSSSSPAGACGALDLPAALATEEYRTVAQNCRPTLPTRPRRRFVEASRGTPKSS